MDLFVRRSAPPSGRDILVGDSFPLSFTLPAITRSATRYFGFRALSPLRSHPAQ
jgi:hypothetical protein